MRITEASLIETIVEQGLRDLRELRTATGAGDGCMACRRRLQHYVDEYASVSLYHERVTAVALEVVG